MSTVGQGHCLTFVQGHSGVQTFSVAKLPGPLKPNFMQSFYGLEEHKNLLKNGHMTKIATIPIHIFGKNNLKISETNRLDW